MPSEKQEMPQSPFYGVLGIDDRETDYQLVAGQLDLPTPRNVFADNKTQYHQPEVSKVSCTVHGSLGAASDLLGVKFTLEQRKELWTEALRLGAKEGYGWFTARAVDLVRKYALKYFNVELYSFTVKLTDEEAYRALDRGYTLVCSFSGNSTYNQDKDDGKLDLTSFGKFTYGHCVRMVGTEIKDEYELIVDNYITTRKTKNIYKVSRDKLDDLVSNGVFSANAYVYAIKEDFDAYQRGNTFIVPVWAGKSWEKALAKKVIAEGIDPNANFGDAKLEDIFVKCGLLSKNEGSVSYARLAVALDRANLLN